MSTYDRVIALPQRPLDRSLLVIGGVVIAVHLLLMLWAILGESVSRKIVQPAARRLVVQTVSLNPVKQPPQAVEIVKTPPVEVPKEEPPVPVVVEKEQIVAEIPVIEVKKEEKPKVAESVPEDKPQEMPIKEEKKIEESPIPPQPSPTPVAKPKPKTIAPEKKPEAAKIKDTKTVAKKTTETKKSPAKKTEVAKKEKSPAKPATKKTTVKTEVNPKAASDKVAAEKQKKREAEMMAMKMKQQKLLSQAQETIAKIDKSRDKVSLGKYSSSSNLVSSPGAISNLQIDALPEGNKQVLSDHEVSYRDELASRLKLLLKLPEYGEVKIKLTLERSGKVAKVVVVSTESAANRKYIEKTLPTLTFPAFGANFDQAKQFTFSITLSNEL